MRFLKIISLTLFLSFCIKSISAQRHVIYAEDLTYSWFNIFEFISANMNFSYRTHDMSTFELYSSSYSNSFSDRNCVFINNVPYNARWLDEPLFSIHQFNKSVIDSIIINQNPSESSHIDCNDFRIHIFLKDDNLLTTQVEGTNPINDPGPLVNTDLGTPNIERLTTNVGIYLGRSNRKNKTIVLSELKNYSRTSGIVYDNTFNNLLYSRTNPPLGSMFKDGQRNTSIGNMYYGSYHIPNGQLHLLANYVKTTTFNKWYSLSGIEIPYQLDHFQVSSSYRHNKADVYQGSQFNFSFSESDSLDYKPAIELQLNELQFSHVSNFRLHNRLHTFQLSLSNKFYKVRDASSNNSYQYLTNQINVSIPIKNRLVLMGSLSNIGYHLATKLDAKQGYLQVGFYQNKQDVTNYTFSLWKKGIGFQNLNTEYHSLQNRSNFHTRVFDVRLVSTPFIHRKSTFSGYFIIKHYVRFLNEEITYQRIPNSLKLGTRLSYFDSKNVGVLSFQGRHSFKINDELSMKTLFGAGFPIYGNNSFLEYYKSVPTFVFSEILRYKADENFVMELFFRYIPARRMVEYESLEKETGFPPSRVRPIPLLNFSTSMWFFDRRFETKITLRNLLNIPESYDTNGQYYYMSINVAAQINLGL